ncbi:hypothetical protein [Lysobacter solisilvae (ex Woo and Kim 2020)]|uniref:DUF4365 domain-containing protein n=1 Tax=Agrilutibacter terrestris TaxID=2865112 RepID=A0A7H0G0J5_9GAMM|nr:hypothetical protein [Lysobacter terrestris]QNP41811.1 hypothetical protein H8B22_06285 [Lysobacter terrestris]
MTTRDYFAELYVAGLMGDAGWSVYFPKRDVGFDFMASKEVDGEVLIRPVQVKGLYPGLEKTDKAVYGYVGKLSQLHPDMALVLPYFPTDVAGAAPDLIAWMPHNAIRPQASKGYACQPAKFIKGKAVVRPGFAGHFGLDGLLRMQAKHWGVL